MWERAGAVAEEARQEKRATLKKRRRDPRWNRCSLEYWKTSDRARNRREEGLEEQAECEQGTIYDAYVNSWNNGDTACSCHAAPRRTEEKERPRFTEGLENGYSAGGVVS